MDYLNGTHDAGLVALSVGVAIVVSYTALNLAGRITTTTGRTSRMWLLGGAFSMGLGIWSMHFIGMLAFSLPVPVGYDVSITLLSLAIAMLVSAFALFLVSRPHVRRRNLVIGGILMGTGICAMHYTGMFALRMQPPIDYDPALFLGSVLFAMLASTIALWIAFALRTADSLLMVPRKLVSAVVMGTAITGMHYIAMAATRFPADSVSLVSTGVANDWLAITIGIAAFGVLAVTLLLSVVDSRLASHTAGLVRSLRHANEQLHHRALHDMLTELPNRILLQDRIGQAISRSERTGKPFAVMFLDLDRFKIINDSLGHHYGDKVLQAVAARLTGILRVEDTVARIGGDEFVVLLNDIHEPEVAANAARKILTTLSEPFYIEGQEQNISVSIGISTFPSDGPDIRALMVNADGAMYHAKRMGRANYQFFAPEINDAAHIRLGLEKNLRRAIDHDELELYYQPKFHIESGKIAAMEALVRWRNPRTGLLLPDEFIPLAEESGLIVPLGAWVLAHACRQNRAWQMAGLPALRVAVNISAVQFRQTDLVELISKVLEETGLEAPYLELEMTESVIMGDDAAGAAAIIEKLHVLGVSVSVDDFGTGYSSLSYLKRFPIDRLKIDRSFVRDITGDPDDAVIVASVINLAHSLRLSVVAEGVETREQLEFLRSHGCNEYQGYYGSPPLPAAEFERLLRGSVHPGRSASFRRVGGCEG